MGKRGEEGKRRRVSEGGGGRGRQGKERGEREQKGAKEVSGERGMEDILGQPGHPSYLPEDRRRGRRQLSMTIFFSFPIFFVFFSASSVSDKKIVGVGVGIGSGVG